MKKTNIKNGNVYYVIEKNPLHIKKFIMNDNIIVLKPRNIFNLFSESKRIAIKMLDKNYKSTLKKLQRATN
jgi:hypothetical protein